MARYLIRCFPNTLLPIVMIIISETLAISGLYRQSLYGYVNDFLSLMIAFMDGQVKVLLVFRRLIDTCTDLMNFYDTDVENNAQ